MKIERLTLIFLALETTNSLKLAFKQTMQDQLRINKDHKLSQTDLETTSRYIDNMNYHYV